MSENPSTKVAPTSKSAFARWHTVLTQNQHCPVTCRRGLGNLIAGEAHLGLR